MSQTIRRKIGRARPPEAASSETAGRAWRVALARAARDLAGVPLTVTALRDERAMLAELMELPPDRSLLAVLEGPGQGLGLLVLSPEVLAAVIEAQTVGQIGSGLPLPRRPTRTDAAMSVGLIDAALQSLEAALCGSADLCWTAGFRYASFLEDARPIELLLDDVPYRLLHCEVDLAEGRRRGVVLLALPADGRGPRHAPDPDRPDPADADAQLWSESLAGAVNDAEVVLDAVVAQLRLPLAALMAIAPGQILPLGSAALDSVALVARGGHRMARGRLGQNRGLRAVRLTLAESEAAAPAPRPGPRPPVAEADVSAAPLARAG
ncbi:MAG: FliM/FliN family flagellar motor switch protein [Gemmobacter sp.]